VQRVVALAVELLPHLASTEHPVVLLPYAPDPGPQLLVPDRSRWQAARISLPCLHLVLRRRGDRQHPADQLDPESIPTLVDIADYHLGRRSSSAREGLLHANLKALADSLEVGDKVFFAGRQDDRPSLYRSMYIFVLTSLNEGISNTILEAMDSGLPVIVTDVGGNREFLDDEKTCKVVVPDDADAIAVAIFRYLEEPELGESHSGGARKTAEAHFDINGMVGTYNVLYQGHLVGR